MTIVNALRKQIARTTAPWVKRTIELLDLDRDPMTGLPRHSSLNHRMKQIRDQILQGRATDVAVYFLDLNNFKLFNDTRGHAKGDILLKLFARRLEAAAHPANVFRTGGDEFVVVLKNAGSQSNAVEWGYDLCSHLNGEINVAGRPFRVRVGVGMEWSNFVDGNPQNPMELVDRADRVMFRAKRDSKLGLSPVALYKPEDWEESIRSEQRYERLANLVEDRAYQVVYQPIVQLGDQAWVGAEALIRPQGEWRPLDSLEADIAALELGGGLDPLWRHVLAEAVQTLASINVLRGARDFQISINLSAQQLASIHLDEECRRLLALYDVDGQQLVFELTERQPLGDPDDMHLSLDMLSLHGIQFALDDFGCGHSNLERLMEFPSFTRLKLDRAFVRGLCEQEPPHQGRLHLVGEHEPTGLSPHSSRAARVLSHTLALARSLDVTVVAEGVEDSATAGQLQILGCQYAQGYLYGNALSAEELMEALAASPIIDLRAPRASVTPRLP